MGFQRPARQTPLQETPPQPRTKVGPRLVVGVEESHTGEAGMHNIDHNGKPSLEPPEPCVSRDNHDHGRSTRMPRLTAVACLLDTAALRQAIGDRRQIKQLVSDRMSV